jgi:hypothetical protein
MRNYYKPGDFLVVCDVSGQKRLRSDCVKQWDGAIVAKEYAKARHPLDTQRPPPVEIAPNETRPDQEPTYLAPGDVTRNSY